MKLLRRTSHPIKSIAISQHLLLATNFLCHIAWAFFFSLYPVACLCASTSLMRCATCYPEAWPVLATCPQSHGTLAERRCDPQTGEKGLYGVVDWCCGTRKSLNAEISTHLVSLHVRLCLRRPSTIFLIKNYPVLLVSFIHATSDHQNLHNISPL
jgi:hypothetical protein